MVGWGDNSKRPLSPSVQLLHQGVNRLEFCHAVLTQIVAPWTYEYFKKVEQAAYISGKNRVQVNNANDSPKIVETI